MRGVWSIPGFPISVRTQSIFEGSVVVPVIVDTGPLVAFFDRAERYHHWVAERIGVLDQPLLVCEAVLAEVMYLLSDYPKAQDALFDLLESGALDIAFQIEDHVGEIRKLLQKYRDVPMSLADA